MTMIAYAFLQHRRLKTARRGKKKESTDRRLSQPYQPCAKPSSKLSLDHQSSLPASPKMDLQRAAA
jgi:hypothetical protein